MAFPNYKTQGLGQLLAGEDLTNNVLVTEDRSTYTNAAVSALIKTGAGRIKGIMINSSAAGAVVTLADSTTTTTPPIVAFILPASGTSSASPIFYPLPDVEFSTGLYLTIATFAANVTVFWK
jgi:hypothetical protein